MQSTGNIQSEKTCCSPESSPVLSGVADGYVKKMDCFLVSDLCLFPFFNPMSFHKSFQHLVGLRTNQLIMIHHKCWNGCNRFLLRKEPIRIYRRLNKDFGDVVTYVALRCSSDFHLCNRPRYA